MNKYKKFYGIAVSSLIMFLSFGATVGAVSVNLYGNAGVETNSSKASVGATSSASVKMEAGETGDEDNEASNTEKENSDDNNQAEEHKSEVAIIVKSLLSIADRDGGIGDDVRLVAREQASTSVMVKEDMDEINGESKVKVFFLGPNYRNLGELRSSIVTTQNHIARLKKAEDRTTSASVKADLEVQIKALEELSSNTQVFVNANESKLSLFGWFFRVFSK